MEIWNGKEWVPATLEEFLFYNLDETKGMCGEESYKEWMLGEPSGVAEDFLRDSDELIEEKVTINDIVPIIEKWQAKEKGV